MHIHVLGRSDNQTKPSAITTTRCNFVVGSSGVCVLDLVVTITCLLFFVVCMFWGLPYAIKLCKVVKMRIQKRSPQDADAILNRRTSTLDPYHIVSSLDKSILVKNTLVSVPSIPHRTHGTATYDVFYSPYPNLQTQSPFLRFPYASAKSPEGYRSPPLSLVRSGSYPPSPSPRSNTRGVSVPQIHRQ
ncbi:hypothetical protein BJ138DRAFT_1141802, partial [Hygrophoropsis aurantiaca]